jgi:hypothetical protein
MTNFVEVKFGMLGVVANDDNQLDHVQIRRRDNLDGPVPDVAVSLDAEGAILIQIRNGVTATIACRANPS